MDDDEERNQERVLMMFLINKPLNEMTNGQIKGGSSFWHCFLAAQESGWSHILKFQEIQDGLRRAKRWI